MAHTSPFPSVASFSLPTASLTFYVIFCKSRFFPSAYLRPRSRDNDAFDDRDSFNGVTHASLEPDIMDSFVIPVQRFRVDAYSQCIQVPRICKVCEKRDTQRCTSRGASKDLTVRGSRASFAAWNPSQFPERSQDNVTSPVSRVRLAHAIRRFAAHRAFDRHFAQVAN